MIVLDASTWYAAVEDGGSLGQWARAHMALSDLHAPSLIISEMLNIARGESLAERLPAAGTEWVLHKIERHPIELWDPTRFVRDVWALRSTITAYDATYVALAARLSAPLVTLDVRLAKAPGLTCQVMTPPVS